MTGSQSGPGNIFTEPFWLGTQIFMNGLEPVAFGNNFPIWFPVLQIRPLNVKSINQLLTVQC